jgi:hypothetical protein
MGKSNLPPSLGKSAGAKLTVILSSGKVKLLLIMALRTRSLASLTDASGKPTKLKKGWPGEI